jgi:hypothetical protein
MDMDIGHGLGHRHAAWTWTCRRKMDMQHDQRHEHTKKAFNRKTA